MSDKNPVQERDKFKAVWVSHSSMGDFLKCPRLYYLHNVYKKDSRKINITSPAMALGVAVHEVLEPLAWLPSEERFKQPFKELYNKAWKPVAGKLGGFKDLDQEMEYKERGWQMLEKVIANPEPLRKPAIRMSKDKSDLPHYFLNDTDNIILCGKVDWLQYNSDDDSLSILDFKTGKYDESDDSLQLPIYLLLVDHFKNRPIKDAKYWYIGRDDRPKSKELPSKEDAYKRVLDVASRVELARKNNDMKCPNGDEGCRHCQPFERILRGEAEFVGIGGYNQELYVV